MRPRSSVVRANRQRPGVPSVCVTVIPRVDNQYRITRIWAMSLRATVTRVSGFDATKKSRSARNRPDAHKPPNNTLVPRAARIPRIEKSLGAGALFLRTLMSVAHPAPRLAQLARARVSPSSHKRPVANSGLRCERAVVGARWHGATMDRRVVQAGNTVVPALLAVESLGFIIEVSGDSVSARRGQEEYGAEDPVALLGLIRLVELRSWDWSPSDEQIDETLRRYGMS